APTLAMRRGFHDLECRRIAEQTPQRRRIQAVAAAIGAEAADEARACQRQIAHRIQRLVADELVAIAQTLHIDDRIIIADDERILERGTERIACGPKPLHIAQEAEGPRPGDLAPEYIRINVIGIELPADRRTFEIDPDLE